MALKQAESKDQISIGLQIGKVPMPKTCIDSDLGHGRKLAPLSAARLIQESGRSSHYWISTEDVPTKEGFYIDNKDGTFKEVSKNDFYIKYDWSDRLHVSEEAAAKAAKGDGPLALVVWGIGGFSSRLIVYSVNKPGFKAPVASVPQASIEEVAQQTVRKE